MHISSTVWRIVTKFALKILCGLLQSWKAFERHGRTVREGIHDFKTKKNPFARCIGPNQNMFYK